MAEEISLKNWTAIQSIFLNYSRASAKNIMGLRDLPHKSNDSLIVAMMELSNLLSDFK